MSKQKEAGKTKYIEQLNVAGRQFSDATIMFHELVAQKAGLAGADHKYLGILMQHDAMTAGELAAHTGLTTGAITGVIDRLEKRGFVKRENDPNDRRKVVIVPNKRATNQVFGPIFSNLLQKTAMLYDQFTEAELAVILNYMEKTQEVMKSLVAALKLKENK